MNDRTCQETASLPDATGPPQRGSGEVGVLPRRTKACYGVSALGGGLVEFSLTLYLFYFYTDLVGVSPSLLGIIVPVAILIDALTDIPMGWWSDRTHSRWGRRRPFILFAAAPFGLAFFLLFTPPDQHAGLYLFVVLTSFYLAMTVFLVPYNGLGTELTLDHHERTSLMAYRQVFYLVGLFCGTGAKLVTELFANERTGFAITGLAFGVVITGTILLTFAGTSERSEFGLRRSEAPRPRFGDMIRNRPFVIMLVTYIILNVSIMVPGVLGAQVAKHWLGAEHLFPFGMATFLLCGVVAVPFWVWLSRRLDKRPALILSFLLAAGAVASAALLTPQRVWLFFVCFTGMGLAFGGFMTLPISIIGDTIDYDEYRTGRRRDGFYWGMAEFCRKVSQGAAFGVIGLTLGHLGYDGQAAEQSPSALWGLKALFVGVPLVLFLASALAFWPYPLTKERHNQIHREMGRALNPPAQDGVAGDG